MFTVSVQCHLQPLRHFYGQWMIFSHEGWCKPILWIAVCIVYTLEPLLRPLLLLVFWLGTSKTLLALTCTNDAGKKNSIGGEDSLNICSVWSHHRENWWRWTDHCLCGLRFHAMSFQFLWGRSLPLWEKNLCDTCWVFMGSLLSPPVPGE